MRRIHIDDLGVGLDQLFQSGQVVRPAIFKTAVPFADLGSSAARDFKAGFITRRLNDHVIARPYESVIKNKNAFFGRSRDQNIIGFDASINFGDRFAKPGRSGRFRVPTPVIEEAFVSTGLEIEQFPDGSRFRIRARKQILGAEFVFSKILFDPKGLDLHGQESGKPRGQEYSAKLAAAQSNTRRQNSKDAILDSGAV
jgi:hypothetical protein